MRIVFLSHLDLNLYLFRLPLMRELLKRGVEVIALVPEGRYCELLEKEGVRVVNYSFQRGTLNVFAILKSIWELSLVLKELKPDLVHTFTHQPNIYGSVAAKLAGVGNVFNLVEGLGSFFTDNSLKSKTVRLIIKTLYKIVLKNSKKVVFVNKDDAEFFLKNGLLTPSQVEVIRSVGIDTSEFAPLPKPEKLLKEFNIKKPVVLMIARVIKDKGVREYIKAAEIVREAEFLYAGEIDWGNKNSFNPDWKSVRYLGFREDIKKLISLSDVVVLPSYREGVPRTLLEAAAMGKAIVTTDAPGCREVVEDGKNGFLVPVKDYKTLAAKIDLLVKDEKLRERFGKYSRIKAVREFDVKKVVREYLKMYGEVLDV